MTEAKTEIWRVIRREEKEKEKKKRERSGVWTKQQHHMRRRSRFDT